jgi:4-hydroxy-2-oxoglutarate aldolase
MTSSLAGIYAPICTPFAADEALDVEALRHNMERYAVSGIHGYLAIGSNGENRALSEDERRQVLEEVVRHKGAGQTVMAGATYDAQRDTERFLADAAEIGADYGLVLAPGYYKKQMTSEVLQRYYASLADAAPLPLIIYNAPSFSGVTLGPELIERLADHPNIAGMKYTATAEVETYVSLQRPGFDVLAGSASILREAMAYGSPGGTVSLANAFPALAVRLYELCRADDEIAAASFAEYVARVNAAISGKSGVAGVKAAMELAGYRAGIPRRPLLPLDPAGVAELRNTLRDEGVLA